MQVLRIHKNRQPADLGPNLGPNLPELTLAPVTAP